MNTEEFFLMVLVIFSLVSGGIILGGLYNYFTMTPEERTVEYGMSHVEVCIEGVWYIRGLSSRGSFTPMLDKEGKPLECILRYKPELNTRYLKTNVMPDNRRLYLVKVKKWEKFIISLGMNKTNTNRAISLFNSLIQHYTFHILESGKLKRSWIVDTAPEFYVFRRKPDFFEFTKHLIPYWFSEDLTYMKFSLPIDEEYLDEKENYE
jgi:hypothetical protein